MIIQKNRRVCISSQNLIHFAIGCHGEKNIWVLQLNIAESKKKYMFAGILLHIIKLKTVYSYESHHYGGCNQSLTSHASTLPSSRKVKPAIRNYSAHKERQKFWFSIPKLTSQLTIGNCQMAIHLVLRHIFLGPTQQTDPNKINVLMSPAIAFVYDFLFEIVY